MAKAVDPAGVRGRRSNLPGEVCVMPPVFRGADSPTHSHRSRRKQSHIGRRRGLRSSDRISGQEGRCGTLTVWGPIWDCKIKAAPSLGPHPIGNVEILHLCVSSGGCRLRPKLPRFQCCRRHRAFCVTLSDIRGSHGRCSGYKGTPRSRGIEVSDVAPSLEIIVLFRRKRHQRSQLREHKTTI
jgi:hypothetical protein